jgi:ABC-2 type transport system ATP-binding protein
MNALQTFNLKKNFGAFTALDGLNLSVPKGAVFGFLGPNGAGKTTALRILTGLARPTSGRAEIIGTFGYLPEYPAFFGWMNAREYLEFCADLFGLAGEKRRRRISELLEFSSLAANDRPTAGYSRGMKQRLGLAQALINDPDILLLDEPTSALDPIGRKEVLEMIDGLSQQKTVLLSTHILADAERVCDRVAMINKGKLVLEADLETLKTKYFEPIVELQVDEDADKLVQKIATAEWAVAVRADGQKVVVKTSDLAAAQRALPKILGELAIPLHRFELFEPSLEDIFIKMMA